MLFSKRTGQDVRPRQTGSVSARAELEKSASDLWVIWHTMPNVHPSLAVAASSISVLLGQLIRAKEDDRQRLDHQKGTALFPSVLTMCRCQECSQASLKPCLWAFSENSLVRKKYEWLELTPPPNTHLYAYIYMFMHVYTYNVCVDPSFPAGWKDSVESEEWK